jgi:hypothetical protein
MGYFTTIPQQQTNGPGLKALLTYILLRRFLVGRSWEATPFRSLGGLLPILTHRMLDIVLLLTMTAAALGLE